MGRGSTGNRPSTSPDVSFRAPDPSFGAERVRIGASDKPIHREIEMTIQYSKKPNWFAASWFGQFMASGLGRATRIVAGVALIAGGLFAVGGTTGSILAVIGLVPLLAGTFDVCVFSRLFGGPFSGTAIRACASH